MRESETVTHEDVVFPGVGFPGIRVELTGDEHDECFLVVVHGVKHYIHATTARALHWRLERKLKIFARKAKRAGLDFKL